MTPNSFPTSPDHEFLRPIRATEPKKVVPRTRLSPQKSTVLPITSWQPGKGFSVSPRHLPR